VALMTAVIGWFFIPETRHRKIWEEVGGETEPTEQRENQEQHN